MDGTKLIKLRLDHSLWTAKSMECNESLGGFISLLEECPEAQKLLHCGPAFSDPSSAGILNRVKELAASSEGELGDELMTSRTRILEDTSALVRRARTQLQSQHHHQVTREHRASFQIASILMAACLLLPSHSDSRGVETSVLSALKALQILDEALIVTGFPMLHEECVHQLYSICECLPQYQPPWTLLDEADQLDNEWQSSQAWLGTVPRFPAIPELTADDILLAGAGLRESPIVDTPFVIRGAIGHWAATRKWTFQYLGRTAGHRLVPVELGNSYLDSDWTQQLIPFHRFLEHHIISSSMGKAPDDDRIAYLAQYTLLQQLPHLRRDISIPDELYMLSDTCQEGIQINLWIGPKNTLTPMHHDGARRNLFCQLRGSKRFVLVPPNNGAALSPLSQSLSNTSAVDVEDYVSLQSATLRALEIVVHAGDMLFIPPHWWHQVRGLTASIGASYWW